MDLKVATIEDLPLVRDMALKFLENTEYNKHFSMEKLTAVIEELILDGGSTKIIILCEDKGMIVGIVNPFLYGTKLVATELGWWVEPEERKNGVGESLLKAFEFWAHKVGCSMITMISLDDELGQYYEKKGYKLYERAYMKEI